MLDQLLPYYERELTYFRTLSKEFAQRYPKIAARLLLDADTSEDPHVERLIEAFAFLTARIHRKLDDEYPEITEALLNLVYPHYLRPIPSLSIAKFELDRLAPQVAKPQEIPKHSVLISKPVQGVPCKFRTAYPVELWPIEVAEAALETQVAERIMARHPSVRAVLRLKLRTIGAQASFDALSVDRLRFFLDGEIALMHQLYEILFHNVIEVLLVGDTPDEAQGKLSPDAVRPVGFALDEGLLGYDARSFLGYRLLTEYFVFPEKFLFFDLIGLERRKTQARPRLHNERRKGHARRGRELIVEFLLRDFEETELNSRLMRTLAVQNFQLGCTPIVNLFKQPGEPIRMTHTRSEYPVIPDSRRLLALEVYAIDSVRKVEQAPDGQQIVDVHPFYSLKHGQTQDQDRAYWYASRRPATRSNDAGTDVSLAVVDLNFRPTNATAETLSIELTCTNRDLPALLPFRGVDGDLTLETGSAVKRIRCLRKPTPTLRPAQGRGAQWRLISHLTLNHLSLVEGGRDALTEILALYNFSDSSVTRRQIAGISNVSAKSAIARIPGSLFPSFARGIEVTLELDEENFVGSGRYLFCAVLERFLALYVAPNSFSQLRVVSKQEHKEICRWPPRSGEALLA
jgi:type VI secretion system protein ImpG